MGTGQGYRGYRSGVTDKGGYRSGVTDKGGYRSGVTDKGGYRSGISWVQVRDIVGTGQG